MTNRDLMDLLLREGTEYRLAANDSIVRNKHMNEYRGEEIPQDAIDALLVDFLNFIISHQGGDWGLYAKDLRGER